jgi:hypothetical protein
VPADVNVSCNSIPIPATVCAADVCSNVTLEFSEQRITPPACVNDVLYILVRTWTAIDVCGNQVSGTQHVYVIDTATPYLPPHANEVQSCSNVTLPSPPVSTDSCSPATVTAHHTRVNGSCPDEYVLYIAWKATDSCGNFAWQNYTITVIQTAAPNLVTQPNQSYECSAPPQPSAVATGQCGSPVTSSVTLNNISVTCPFAYVIERLVIATDACGNSANFTQIINVTDSSYPVFVEALPQNLTVNCSAPPAPTLTAIDNCGPATVVFSEQNVSVTCAHSYVLRRRWQATDLCNHVTTHDQYITVEDTMAPTLSSLPSAVTYECTPEAPPALCATDNCQGVRMTFLETTIPGNCPFNYQLNRTWTFTDLCGNERTVNQLVTVQKTQPPVFTTSPPGPITVNCSLPSIAQPTATTDCGSITYSSHNTRANIRCAYDYDYLVAIKATDECGNYAWFNYTIFVRDRSPPIITHWSPAPPANTTFTCGHLPAAPTPSATGLCGPATATRLPDIQNNQSCNAYTLLRRWLITDTCNNTLMASQLLTSVSAGLPTLANIPMNLTLNCTAPIPSFVRNLRRWGFPATSARARRRATAAGSS